MGVFLKLFFSLLHYVIVLIVTACTVLHYVTSSCKRSSRIKHRTVVIVDHITCVYMYYSSTYQSRYSSIRWVGLQPNGQICDDDDDDAGSNELRSTTKNAEDLVGC